MIAMLTGRIAARIDPYIILDVHGVGYKVFVSPTTISQSMTDPLSLFIHTLVREDALELYGFADTADLQLFEQFISVSGIGCKTAMGIFTLGKRAAIIQAILQSDHAFFTGVPRLGKKNAQKLIIELQSKLDTQKDGFLSSERDGKEETVRLALEQFGYSIAEIRSALQSIQDESLTENEKIRYALKFLGKK